MSDLDHLKLCTDHDHHSAYSCARCNRHHCTKCDRAAEPDRPVKTMVRWCPDWRCQREERIENGVRLDAGMRVMDIAWQAYQEGRSIVGRQTIKQDNADFRTWWAKRMDQGCAMPKCEKCGHPATL